MGDNEDHTGNSLFKQKYRCYPVSFIEKSHLENGGKIILPPSALHQLAYLEIDYPMLFEISNLLAGRVSHCGVLEFIADEGLIFLPQWMMDNMLLQEGDIVQVKNVSLVKGSFVKLQPHTMDFLDISNPKAILETTLRNYACLTTGDTIMVAYNNKKFYIDIVETKPSAAISIVETDCDVDFAPPLDFKESEQPAKRKETQKADEEPAKKKLNFSPFCGSARRLDGKPSTEPTNHPEPKPKPKPNLPENAEVENKSTMSSNSSSRQRAGKLVFGSNGKEKSPSQSQSQSQAAANDSNPKTPAKGEESKFQAFTGKKYSLKG